MRYLASILLLVFTTLPAGAAERPNVVLVTLDTTRADRMGFLGSKRGLTPEMDALARQGTVFENAFAQAPITTVSHATILSGTYPQLHRVNDFGVALPDTVPWLPDLLRARGYQTAAFVGALILDPRGGLAPGFDRGFDTYDAGFRVKRGKEDRYATMERRGGDVVSRALDWLSRRPAGPFFLWVHLYDAHDPYEAPEPFRSRFARTPYDGEIAYADAQVGRLVAALRSAGLLDGTAVAVTADHGESLGEHGESTHGVFLYEPTIRVPLFLKLPGGRGAGRRVAARVSTVDLSPTLLELAGVPAPTATQGQSLLPLLASPNAADRPAYAETDYPRRAFGWSSLAAWRVDRFLYVMAPRRELYDLAADPASARNLADERATVADRVARDLDEFRRRTSASVGAVAAPTVDPQLAEKLAALGYVSAGSAAAPATGIDPKDKVAVANTLHDAILSLENGDTARAGALLERVVATDPQIPMAQLQLGVARCRERKYAQAIAPLRRAIELQPDAVMAHYEMGIALFETGDLKTAAGHFEIVAAKMPKFADARFSLGSVYARIDRVNEAVAELRAALELDPRHYRANLLLGRILTLQGQAASAVPYLQRAAEAQASSVEAQAFLADAYQALGRADDAARARARAQQLRKP
jgi:arylsulfatase A-like enzyme/cytochrome c-type biogenesis protein CcmH/NrfG